MEEHQILTQINPIGSIYFGSSEFDAFSRMLAIGFAPLLPKGIQPKLEALFVAFGKFGVLKVVPVLGVSEQTNCLT